MLDLRLLQVSDYLQKPWKNGAGISREVAVDSETPFRWRLSLAKLSESSSFSLYAGYSRILVILNGGPVTVIHDEDKKRTLRAMDTFAFDGGSETRAIVGAAAEDFNVFALTGKAKAGAYPTFFGKGEDMQFPIVGQQHFIFCVEGKVEILDPNSDKQFILESKESLQISRNSKTEYLNVRARGQSDRAVCLWIVIHV
jgi:environmental stress-induced protein Ves